MVVAPSLKVTVPPAFPPKARAMFAVKVTEEFTIDGFCDDSKVVTVAALFTVCATMGEVLLSKLVLPR